MKRIASESQLHDDTPGDEPSARRRPGAEPTFRPAFLDYSSCTIYMSRFADGRLAPVHIRDTLPEGVLAKGTLIAGFERAGFFYTRRMVAKACEEWRI